MKPTNASGLNFRRIILIASIGLLAVYALFVVTGYLWVNYGLKNRQITLAQVAFLRLKEVRRDLAVQQLTKAKAALERKDYAAAYLGYSSALRNDPDNADVRLAAAQFFVAAGAGKTALTTLEQGLDRSTDFRIANQLFELLLSSGADARTLELLHGRFAAGMKGANGATLKLFEVRATLTLQGPGAAAALVERYPELSQSREAIPFLAQIQWLLRNRLKAIQMLSDYVGQGSGDLAVMSVLSGWQQAAGMGSDALQTARLACGRFPDDPAAAVLLIGALPPASPEWYQTIQNCLKRSGDRADTMIRIANLAGERGWVDLARNLYIVGAGRSINPSVLGVTYADALMHVGRYAAARDVLQELEGQIAESDVRMMALVRDQQIVAAAALGDQNGVRDFARRLAVTLGNDPDALEIKRRRFSLLNIADAVTELTRMRSASTPRKPGS